MKNPKREVDSSGEIIRDKEVSEIIWAVEFDEVTWRSAESNKS